MGAGGSRLAISGVRCDVYDDFIIVILANVFAQYTGARMMTLLDVDDGLVSIKARVFLLSYGYDLLNFVSISSSWTLVAILIAAVAKAGVEVFVVFEEAAPAPILFMNLPKSA